MTKEQRVKCHSIIHSASAMAGGVGAKLAQIPGSDNLAIVPIQTTMVIALGAVFGVTLTKSSARAVLATSTSTFIGRGISQVLIGWIPVVGNVTNAATAAGITEAIGWAVAHDFDSKK